MKGRKRGRNVASTYRTVVMFVAALYRTTVLLSSQPKNATTKAREHESTKARKHEGTKARRHEGTKEHARCCRPCRASPHATSARASSAGRCAPSGRSAGWSPGGSAGIPGLHTAG